MLTKEQLDDLFSLRSPAPNSDSDENYDNYGMVVHRAKRRVERALARYDMVLKRDKSRILEALNELIDPLLNDSRLSESSHFIFYSAPL